MKYLVFSLALLASEVVYGQENDENFYESCSRDFSTFRSCFRSDSVLSFRSRKGFFPSTLNNLVDQVRFPSGMGEKECILFSAGAMLVVTSIAYDNELDAKFKPIKDRNPFIESVSPELTELGDYYGYALLAGFGTASICFHNYRGFRVSLHATEAAIAAGIWTRVIKILSGRMRPGQTYGDPQYKSDHWFGPFGQFDSRNNSNRGIGAFDAFPSGHTAAALAIATVFANEYADYKSVPFISYSLAGMVAVSRLIEHEHWVSDILVGGTIGYFCGKQVVDSGRKLFPGRSHQLKKSRACIYPFNKGDAFGFSCRIIF